MKIGKAKDEDFVLAEYGPIPKPKTTELVYQFLHGCDGRFESAKVEINKDSISLEVKLSNIIPGQEEGVKI